MSQTETSKKKKFPILKAVSKKAGKAIMDFAMIEPGDKIAIAVSGGKDSLSLMHVMRDRQKCAPFDFHYEAVHVDFDLSGFDPIPLMNYLKEQDFPHRVLQVDELKGREWQDLDCFTWSKHRRKALFELCKQEGFTKIASGHHMDDIVETIILNQFFKSEIGAMKPKQEFFNGKIHMIRPLAYVREESMIQLARELEIDGMDQSKCAYDDVSRRMIVKKMLRDMEQTSSSVVPNIFKSLQNIRNDYLLETVTSKPSKI